MITHLKYHKYLIKKFFCESSLSLKKKDSLYEKCIDKNLGLKNLSIQILRYLENNQEIYKRLCNESEILSFEISSNPNDFIKNELMRINKQINDFSKENYYYDEYSNLIEELLSANSMQKEALDIGENELALSLNKDLDSINSKIYSFQNEIIEFLIPEDDNDDLDSIIMEIKSASGGIESCLFAEDILNMYKIYISRMGWNIETLSYAIDNSVGKGCKNGSFKLIGTNIYKYFKFESGVHKVQRVPITEKNGRIHSSTCQIVILADTNFKKEEINERDLKIDVFRASGAGGQSVNKTESAVRITHLPTGIVVQNQDERDQHRNKAKAMEVLKQRIYEKQLSQHNNNVSQARKSQIGSGNLSEKIRTYNWPDSRVTDHRIGLTLYGIENMLNSNHLEEIHEKLIEREKYEKLNSVLEKLQNII